MRLLTIGLVIICASESSAAVKYTERDDDFSNDKVYSLEIPSKNRLTSIFIECYPKNKLNIQLASQKTMFPNTSGGSGMHMDVTHKFDRSESAVTSSWYMNLMKYNNAWFRSNHEKFAADAITSSQLVVRLNRRNTIHRFSLSGTSVYIPKILSMCGYEL